MQEAKKEGKKVRADFKHTGRNRMMYATFKFSNFKEAMTDSGGTIVMENDLENIQEFPAYVNLTIR
jgi:hypothetical protein